MQTDRDVKPGPVSVPWAVADRAWAGYSARYGRDQSVERLAQRGGFSWGEMDSYFPGWREATDEWVRLRKELAAEQAARVQAEQERDEARDRAKGASETLEHVREKWKRAEADNAALVHDLERWADRTNHHDMAGFVRATLANGFRGASLLARLEKDALAEFLARYAGCPVETVAEDLRKHLLGEG